MATATATRRSRASRAASEAPEPAAKAARLAPVVITAPKGGTQTVAPRKGKIAAAIKASGSTIMAISRANGLNPSQMRRLASNQVSKVDLVRAEAIAAALGVKLADLFGEPADKAKAAAKAAPESE
jgi:lambda repressor-like predicted transcriptional regulator